MASKRSQNIFTNKTLLAQLVLIAIIAVGILIFEQLSDKKLSDKRFGLDNKGHGEATLLIDFEGVKRKFQGEVVEKMTVLDAVNAATAAGEIELIYSIDRENNTKIAAINDHLTEGGKQFVFYVNSEKLNSNTLNKTYIKPGDEIAIRLKKL